MKLKVLFIELTYIRTLSSLNEIVYEMLKFLVFSVIMPLNNWNPIIRLESKTVRKIINEDGRFQVAATNNSQIFDKESVFCFHAIIAIQNPVYVFFIWINIIHNRLCIIRTARCEDINIPILGE